jgi:two-component system LytT family response regulator
VDTMINTLIIDDEDDARFMLKSNLEDYFKNEINIIGEASDIKQAIDLIEQLKPDLIFLDIQMKTGTGFDVLEALKERTFEVIFVTAYDQYALRAFQVSAVGYLMKPIRQGEFKNMVQAIVERIEENKRTSNSRIKVLIDNFKESNPIKKLVISNVEGFQIVELESILRLEADRNYTNIFILNGKKILSSKNLGEYENFLIDLGFFRSHQSSIINLKHVTGFNRNNRTIEMIDGSKVILSRHRKNEFLDRFN